MSESIKKVIFPAFTIIGIVIVIISIYTFFVMNFDVGVIVQFGIGVMFILIGKTWNKMPKTGIFKLFKILSLIGFALIFIMLLFIFINGAVNTVDFNEEAVIVLGCGIKGEEVTGTLKRRLDKCIEYANINNNAIIVVSGGQGPQEDITEALAMERYLIDNGISSERIIKEDMATSTYENFVFSKNILDNKFKDEYKIVYITNRFHIYRAGKLAEIAGLNAEGYGAEDDMRAMSVSYLREILAVIKLWVFKR